MLMRTYFLNTFLTENTSLLLIKRINKTGEDVSDLRTFDKIATSIIRPCDRRKTSWF